MSGAELCRCRGCGGWGRVPCRYCADHADDFKAQARRQHAIAERLRAVEPIDVEIAERIISADADFGEVGRIAWAVLRLATERPALWDAMAQVAHMHALEQALGLKLELADTRL